MSVFAPPNLFAALAVAAVKDPDLVRGTHLRLLPSPALGFPLAPVGLYRVQAVITTPDLVWRDAQDQIVADGNLDAHGGVLYASISVPAGGTPDNEPVDVAVEITGSFSGVVALLDAQRVPAGPGPGLTDRDRDRELCRVSRPPYLLGAPIVNRLRLQGRGVAKLSTWRVYPLRALEQMFNQTPTECLSLPITGQRPWYAGGLGADRAMDRVRHGAPQRLTPAEQPDGPLDPVTSDHERQRVQPQAEGIVDACEQLLGDATVWPAAVRLTADNLPVGQVARHSVDIGVQNLLLMQAMDPGLARYLGLMTRLDDLPAAGEPVAWVALALYGMKRPAGGLALKQASLYDRLGAQPPLLQRVITHHLQLSETGAGRGAFASLAAQVARRPGGAVRAVLAVCAAVPPPDRPQIDAPEVSPVRARWIGHPTLPSSAFRQDMTWDSTPLGGLLALGRLEAAGWRSRHRPAPLAAAGDSPPRVLPLLMGRTAERAPAMARGLLSDAPVPCDPDAPPVSSRYRVALADLFGRFGPPADFDVAPPSRPAPPTTAPQIEVMLDGPSGTEIGRLSPGRLSVTVPAPNVADMAAGSLPLTHLHLSFDGVRVADVALLADVLVNPGAARTVPLVTAQIVLPDLDVAQAATGVLTATFENTAGQLSAPASVNVGYLDRRMHPVVPSGLGLIWTSRPGPAPEVELKLQWPAPPGAIYRVFMADAAGLGLPVGPRADQAVEAGVRARAGTLGARERFRLLGDVKESGGHAVIDERLPRSLAGVQVLRIVPLTPNGREAPFDDCPVVPVAVPGERRPPAARLSGRVDPGTGRATLRIDAEGFDWVALQAAEPGLFTQPPAADARAPEYRLRRASGPVPEPLYAREVAHGTLSIEREGVGWRAVAEWESPAALTPYLQTTWWAEVRLGAERRVRAGFEETPPADGTQPLIESQQRDLPQPYSLPSAPATTMRVLAVPDAPSGAVVGVAEGGGTRWLTLQLDAPPAAPRGVVPPYKLRLWEQWGDSALAPAEPDVVLDGTDVAWKGPTHLDADVESPWALLMAYVDPLGRVGSMARVEV